MQNKTVIRAAEYIPEPAEPDAPESFQLSRSEGMLISLFGSLPDYSDPKFEELWQKVFDGEDNEMTAYCLEKGVDVFETDVSGQKKEPVPGWRDIAVMLKAVDSGLLKPDYNN